MLRKLSCVGLASMACFSRSATAYSRPALSLLATGKPIAHNSRYPVLTPSRWISSSSPVFGRSAKNSNAPMTIAERVLAQYELEESKPKAPLSPDHEIIVRMTRQWVKDWVIRHRLCPWAASVYSEAAMRVRVIDADLSSEDGYEEMIYKILVECMKLSHSLSNNAAHKTTMLVIPALKDFDEFLEVHEVIEQLLPTDEEESPCDTTDMTPTDAKNTAKVDDAKDDDQRIELEELLQVATFHPLYVFAESESAKSPENYTNRAFYPTFHLLSVRDMASVLESFPGDPDDIWRKNVELMRSLGRSAIRAELKEIARQVLNIDAHVTEKKPNNNINNNSSDEKKDKEDAQ